LVEQLFWVNSNELSFEVLSTFDSLATSKTAILQHISKDIRYLRRGKLHWFGMEEIAELSSGGRVLIAGLGLGLILHHLVKRRDITEIIVYEIDREIISFIKPYIPKDSRIKIINQDYVSFCVQNSISKKETFNTAILDLWVIGEQDSSEHRQHVHSSMATLYTLTKTFSENVLIWGVKGYKL